MSEHHGIIKRKLFGPQTAPEELENKETDVDAEEALRRQKAQARRKGSNATQQIKQTSKQQQSLLQDIKQRWLQAGRVKQRLSAHDKNWLEKQVEEFPDQVEPGLQALVAIEGSGLLSETLYSTETLGLLQKTLMNYPEMQKKVKEFLQSSWMQTPTNKNASQLIDKNEFFKKYLESIYQKQQEQSPGVLVLESSLTTQTSTANTAIKKPVDVGVIEEKTDVLQPPKYLRSTNAYGDSIEGNVRFNLSVIEAYGSHYRAVLDRLQEELTRGEQSPRHFKNRITPPDFGSTSLMTQKEMHAVQREWQKIQENLQNYAKRRAKLEKEAKEAKVAPVAKRQRDDTAGDGSLNEQSLKRQRTNDASEAEQGNQTPVVETPAALRRRKRLETEAQALKEKDLKQQLSAELKKSAQDMQVARQSSSHSSAVSATVASSRINNAKEIAELKGMMGKIQGIIEGLEGSASKRKQGESIEVLPRNQEYAVRRPARRKAADASRVHVLKVKRVCRPWPTLWNVSWVQLKPYERRMLQNLGWQQPSWDSKDQKNYYAWPKAMFVPYVQLRKVTQASLQAMDVDGQAWDLLVAQRKPFRQEAEDTEPTSMRSGGDFL